MSNINRDYTIVLDVKSSAVTAPNMYFYNTDISTSNIYVKLVIKESTLNVYPVENASDYIVSVSIIKPNNVVKTVMSELVNEEESIFEFDLPEDCTNLTGNYIMEFDVSCTVDGRVENVTSFPSKYEVRKSILTDFKPSEDDTEDNVTYKELLARVNRAFDDVQVNEEETGQAQVSLDFYSNGTKIKNLVFAGGGGGGGGGGSNVYISTSLEGDVMVPTGTNFELPLEYSSPNPGSGTVKVFVNDIQTLSTKIAQGASTVSVPSSSFSKGENKLVVYVVDKKGNISNSLTFYIRYGGTELISTFDASVSYDYGSTVRYYFTPTALDTSLKLTFYMRIDGELQTPVFCTSDVRSYFTFPNTLSVGSHYCEAWVTDGVNSSNVITFNLIILDASSIVVASNTTQATIQEGAQLSLDYRVYMKNNTSFIVKVYVDDSLVSTGTCGLDTNYYRTTSLKQGTHTVRIDVWNSAETVKGSNSWTVTVTEADYQMLQPVTAGALALFTAKNKSNTSSDKETWKGTTQDNSQVEASLHNFTFDSENGWINNKLIISGNSYVEIPVKPLSTNAKYGMTIDIEFLTKPIGVDDAEVLTLWDDVDNCGIKITTEKLILRSKAGNECSLYFSEDEKVSAMFVIDRFEKVAKIYLNGVMCAAFMLSDYTVDGVTHYEDFTVNNNIVLGGYNKNGYCEITNFRVYEIALATDEILNNYISNETDLATQKDLFEFQKGNTLPTLTIHCDFSGLGKDDKKPCDITYLSPDTNLYGESFNLTGKTSTLQYQGTSSMAYPIKNYKIKLKDENGNKWKYNPFSDGQPESTFTLKADFMSSGHWQNTGLAKWVSDNLYGYNTSDEKSMNPMKWYSVSNGGDISETRETINGFPCRLILVNDGSTALNEGQNEPTPGNTKDMGIFNLNLDKSCTDSFGLDNKVFPQCASYEVVANSDTSAGAFVPYSSGSSMTELEYLQDSFELRYPDDKEVGADYGYLNMTETKSFIDTWLYNGERYCSKIPVTYFGTRELTVETESGCGVNVNYYDASGNYIRGYGLLASGSTMTVTSNVSCIAFTNATGETHETVTINGIKYTYGNDITGTNNEIKIPYVATISNANLGLKRVIDWVGNATNEEFVRDFENYFNKEYTFRYYLLVITLGMVDNLGKNMMLDTWDGKIWYPRFYDLDTICSYNNAGLITYDVDIEMAQGYWNTSASRLWTKIRDNFHNELVEMYRKMRASGLSYDNLMDYFYGQQIGVIPETYYNKDADTKYLPFADQYLGMAHGNGYEHLKRWLKRRLVYTDTLYDYSPSYNNDVLTIRANTTEPMSITIETYTPLYQHVSWYNGQMDKMKIDGKTAVTFTGTAAAATDQEVLIYGGSNIKRITGISSMNPSAMLIGSATRLTELSINGCPILTDVNANKANFSAHSYISKLDISDCPMLTGTLRINNSPLLRELNFTGTGIDTILKPKSFRNLEVLKPSDGITELSLTDARLLRELTIPQSLTKLVLKNIPNLTTVNATSCDNLSSIIIENPIFNPFDVVAKATNLESVRLINIDCVTSSDEMNKLAKLKGLDTNGNEIAIAESVTGRVTLKTCMQIVETRLKAQFPNVEFTVLKYVEGFTVTFYDGDNNVLYTTAVESGGTAVYEGETPTKTSSAQYHYEFVSWNRSLENITADTIIRPVFNEILRQYTITFVYPNGTVIQESLVNYGEIPTPPDKSLVEGEFDGWTPNLASVTGDTEYTAKPIPQPVDLSVFEFTEVTVDGEKGYNCKLLDVSAITEEIIFPTRYNGKYVLSTSGVSSYNNKSKITSVYIPSTVKIIGNHTLCNCEYLTKINDSAWENLIQIGDYAFSGCDRLEGKVYLPETLTSLGSGAFSYVSSSVRYTPALYLYLSSTIKTIKAYCFQRSKVNVRNISHIEELQYQAFGQFSGTFDTTEWFDSLQTIREEAFYNLSDSPFEGHLVFPEVTYAEKDAFDAPGENILSISFPKMTEVNSSFIVSWGNYGGYCKSYMGTIFGSVEHPVTKISDMSYGPSTSNSNSYSNNHKFINFVTANGLSSDVNITGTDNSKNEVFIFSKKPVEIVTLDSIYYGIIDDTECRCLGVLYNYSANTSITIPEKVNNLPVTKIQWCAFLGNVNLINITANHIEHVSEYAFYEARKLQTVSLPNVKTVLYGAFKSASKLTSLDLPSVENIIMLSVFSNCTSLTSVTFNPNKQFTPDNYKETSNAFSGCSSLTSLDLSMFTLKKSDGTYPYTDSMFSGCSKLTSLISMKNIGRSLYLNSTILDVDSLVDVINNLEDFTGNSSTHTLTLGSTLLAKLTEEQIAVATNKNWTVN